MPLTEDAGSFASVAMSSSGLIYGLESHCRALCSVEADTDRVRFLIGTQGVKSAEANFIHEITVEDDEAAVTGDDEASSRACIAGKTVYKHFKGEVWDLAASPTDADLFVTRHSAVIGGACHVEATVWDKGSAGGATEDARSASGTAVSELRAACSLLTSGAEGMPSGDASTSGSESADAACAVWMPADGKKIMVLSENRLVLNDIGEAGRTARVAASGRLEGKGHTGLLTGAWNPHQGSNQFAAVSEHTVRGWDVRSMEQVWHFENNPAGHPQGLVRSIDFNPNKQYHLATAADDGCVRYWDIRAAAKPLLTRSDHSHWVWSVRFNQFHDQLVLSSSSDGHVLLTCMASISSEPCGHLIDDEEDEGARQRAPLQDGVIGTYDDHEESVYVAVWSAADPWTFASLSYDGRLVINHVPRTIKFKILNLL